MVSGEDVPLSHVNPLILMNFMVLSSHPNQEEVTVKAWTWNSGKAPVPIPERLFAKVPHRVIELWLNSNKRKEKVLYIYIHHRHDLHMYIYIYITHMYVYIYIYIYRHISVF